jgi:hypothetical protein
LESRDELRSGDAANGTATSLSVDPALVADAVMVRAMLAAFGRLSNGTN